MTPTGNLLWPSSFRLTFVGEAVILRSRIRGAGLLVESLRRLHQHSALLIRESSRRNCSHFPRLLGRCTRSSFRAQTTTAGRKPTRQCFCVCCLSERHGESRERSRGPCAVLDRRREPIHQPLRRVPEATTTDRACLLWKPMVRVSFAQTHSQACKGKQ